MTAEKPSKISMRGHHLFCITVMKSWTLWGPSFWENVKKYKQMMEDPDLIIEIVPHCCDTCVFCPQKIEDMCQLYDFIPDGNRIDLEILNQLGLNIGDEITVKNLKRRIKENFSQMPSICTWGCGVTDSGCEQGFEELIKMEP